jgi:hypothetical protein
MSDPSAASLRIQGLIARADKAARAGIGGVPVFLLDAQKKVIRIAHSDSTPGAEGTFSFEITSKAAHHVLFLPEFFDQTQDARSNGAGPTLLSLLTRTEVTIDLRSGRVRPELTAYYYPSQTARLAGEAIDVLRELKDAVGGLRDAVSSIQPPDLMPLSDKVGEIAHKVGELKPSLEDLPKVVAALKPDLEKAFERIKTLFPSSRQPLTIAVRSSLVSLTDVETALTDTAKKWQGIKNALAGINSRFDLLPEFERPVEQLLGIAEAESRWLMAQDKTLTPQSREEIVEAVKAQALAETRRKKSFSVASLSALAAAAEARAGQQSEGLTPSQWIELSKNFCAVAGDAGKLTIFLDPSDEQARAATACS